jgi:outer membrane protein
VRAISIVWVLAGLAMAPMAWATPLSVDDAVTRALGRHPALTAAERAGDAAHARTRQAKTAWLPRVSVDGAYRYQGPVAELAIDTGLTLPGATEPLSITREIGTAHIASVSVTAGWRALDFGARTSRIAAARAMERAAVAEGDEREAEIAQAVRMAYLGVLFQDEVARVTQGALDVTRDAVARAESGLAAGLASKVRVASARARAAELQSRLIAATEGRERVLATLRLLLGLAPTAPIELTDGFERFDAPGPAAPPSTPTDARLAASGEALSLQEQSVRRSALPTLDVYATGGYQYPRTFVETDKAGFVWAAGVKLSWEVFDGALRSRQREELGARQAEVAALRQAASEDTERRVVDADAALRTARAARESAVVQVETAQIYLDAARGGESGGTATALEVRQAEEALDQARLAEIKARFDAAVAASERLRALGVAERPGSGEGSGR